MTIHRKNTPASCSVLYNFSVKRGAHIGTALFILVL